VQLPTLIEGQLSEVNGIGLGQVPAGSKTVYGTSSTATASTARIASPATGAISWDGDANAGENVNVNINFIGSGTGCEGSGTELKGFNDWANIVYSIRASFEHGDGVRSEEPGGANAEMTEAQHQALFEAADADGDGVGDAKGCGNAACVVDVVPGLSTNPVLLFEHHGVPTAIIPVALRSKGSFNANSVNPATLTLLGAPVMMVLGKPACILVDTNFDGKKDLVCKFLLTGLEPGNETAVLEGRTFTNKAIRGQDNMRVFDISH
jgi:hypothetical protein